MCFGYLMLRLACSYYITVIWSGVLYMVHRLSRKVCWLLLAYNDWHMSRFSLWYECVPSAVSSFLIQLWSFQTVVVQTRTFSLPYRQHEKQWCGH